MTRDSHSAAVPFYHDCSLSFPRRSERIRIIFFLATANDGLFQKANLRHTCLDQSLPLKTASYRSINYVFSIPSRDRSQPSPPCNPAEFTILQSHKMARSEFVHVLYTSSASERRLCANFGAALLCCFSQLRCTLCASLSGILGVTYRRCAYCL